MKGLWPEELPSVLWAYHTTVRTFMGETPFSLAFRTEVVVLVKIRMTSHRTVSFDPEKSEEGLKNNLNLLEEKRNEVALRVAVYK